MTTSTDGRPAAGLLAARDWLAQTFHGMTWKWLVVFLLAVAFVALHQGIAIRTLIDGKTFLDKAVGPLRAFVLMLLVFLPVLLAVVAVENRAPRQGPARVAWLITALVAGHAVGALLYMSALPYLYPGGDLPKMFRMTDPVEKLRFYGGRSLWFLVYSATAVVLYHFLKRSNDAAAAMQGEQIRREEIERENAEARLQVMQAQIEPHFLFNTLASVRRLYQTDPASGREMLRHLSRYLTASLPSMRETTSTLERELALATAYLGVHQIRMGARLAFEVDVPAPLRSCVVPPMMIATLVENAVIHGLSPLPQGGRIRIAAREFAGKLVVEVVDDGQGLKDSWGGGVGLANIRERLRSEFGGNAELVLTERSERGVTARLELPLPRVAQAKAA